MPGPRGPRGCLVRARAQAWICLWVAWILIYICAKVQGSAPTPHGMPPTPHSVPLEGADLAASRMGSHVTFLAKLRWNIWREICGRCPSPHSFVSLIWNLRRNNSSTPQSIEGYIHCHTHRLMGISTGNSLSASEHCGAALASGFRSFFLLVLPTIYLVCSLSNNPPLWRCHHSILLGCSKASVQLSASISCPLCVDKSKQRWVHRALQILNV